MTVAHPPIVVAEFTVYCDRADHEVTVITDGTRVASASALGQGFRTAVTRSGTLFTIPCDVYRHGVQCDGEVTVDQSDHTAWRAATVGDSAWLDTDAQTVDVEP